MRISFSSFLLIIFCSCRFLDGDKNESIPSPRGYQLGEPKKIFLAESLDEISGIVFKNDSEIVAENDEEGKIFIINPAKSKQPRSWSAAKAGDFEDITFTGTDWYLLRSDGNIYLLKDPFTDSTTHEKFPSPFTESEFEGLYYDEGRKSLMMVCKSCSMDNEKKFVSVFAFDATAKTWKTEPAFQIDIKSIAAKIKKDKLHFKPSAATINPMDKNLYILSSINKLLVVADVNGVVKDVYELPVSEFKQPEGISFAPNGDMYISNEASDGTANILLFKYNAYQ
ncbi:MAG: SdiA-regulated domain-containing protein [Sphingobacteriales bacterium]